MPKIMVFRRGLIIVGLSLLPLAIGYYYLQGVADLTYLLLGFALSMGLVVGNMMDHRAVRHAMALARIELAQQAIEGARYVQARNFLEDANRLEPNSFEAKVARGELAQAEQDYDRARRQLIEAIELRPNAYRARYALAVTYLQEKKIYEAVSEFTACLRLKPDFADAHYLLAQARELTGEKDKALESYKSYLKLVDEQALSGARHVKHAKVASERVKQMS